MAQEVKKCTAVGIDLGTSFSAISVYDVATKRTRLLSDEMGNVVTPSVVAFTGRGHIVGVKALEQIDTNVEYTITEVKRLLGRKFNEYCVQEDMTRWPFTVVDKDGEPRVKVQTRKEIRFLRPEQISAMILIHLKKIACDQLNLEPFRQLDAVLTVPVDFGDSQRIAIKEACQIAGINCLQLITEPAAGAIAYGIEQGDPCSGQKILVFDMGGGTTDVSLLMLGVDHKYEVLACIGDNRLGGEDLDTVLVKLCMEHIYEDYRVHIEEDYSASMRLRRICEKAKRILSASPRTLIVLDELSVCGEKINFSYGIKREVFEAMSSELLERAVNLIHSCLERAKMTSNELTKVVLIGGSSRIPLLQKLVAEAIPGVPLHNSLTQDEVVASGAAYQAAKEKNFLALELKLTERIPWSLGVNDKDGFTVQVMERNTKIPGEKSKVFTTALENQEAMQFDIYEGENRRSVHNRLLGSMTLRNIRIAPRGMVKADTSFKINASGILNVTAVEQGTTNSISVNIERYKKEVSADKMAVMQAQSEADIALVLMTRLCEELKNVEITVKNSNAMCIEDKNKISAESNRITIWLQDNPTVTPADFTQKVREVRQNLSFCCTVSDSGKISCNLRN